MADHVPQFLHVASHDLIGIDENDTTQVQREQHVQEEDLVAPDDALLLCLTSEPSVTM